MNDLPLHSLVSLAKELAHLDSEYALRHSKYGRLPESIFFVIRDSIADIVTTYLPSSGKGNVRAMQKAIAGVFTLNHVRPDVYWAEVWFRCGRKSLGLYNASKA